MTFMPLVVYMFVSNLPFCRALTRIGNAYQKMDKLKEAIVYFDKSLSEHRDPACFDFNE